MNNKKRMATAQRIVGRAMRSISNKGMYRIIADEVNVGCVRGRQIDLSLDDLHKIEQYYSRILGVSIRTVDLRPDTRMDATALPDEKWAKGGVFESMLNIASAVTPIPMMSGVDYLTPEGVVMSLPLEKLDIRRVKKLVILENGEIITNWHSVVGRLPSKYQDALLAYRGHGTNQTLIKSLLSQVSGEADVALFYDYDAAGFDMLLSAIGARNADVIVPSVLSESIRLKSKLDAYDDQSEQLHSRLSDLNTPKAIRVELDKIKNDRLAIMQEYLITYNAPLKIIKIKA